MTSKEVYDVIIIGGGPAGLTAALYTARNELKVGVLSKDIGGTANSILLLENWPGYKGTGSQLMKGFYDQVKTYPNVEFIMSEADSIQKTKDGFEIKTKKKDLKCKTIIIATGTKRRKLGIPGEDKFLGKGVSYCVTCDAFFFKNKVASVIGGSDCAATSALALADLAKKVYVIYRGEKLRCEEITSDRLEDRKNVEIIYNAVPLELLGKDKVEGLKILHNKSQKTIELEGVFVEIGSTPAEEFAKNLNLDLDDEGYILVDDRMKASEDGVFAAGDITSQKLKQIVVATGQGAIAAKSAYEYLQRFKKCECGK